MDPFFIFGLMIIMTAKCVEFLAPLRLYLLNTQLAVQCKVLRIVLGGELLEPKNCKLLQQDLRSTMVAWLHSEKNAQEQLKMAVMHIHSHSQEIPKNDIDVVTQNIQKNYGTSKYYASMLIGACSKSLNVPAWRRWLNRILIWFVSFVVAFVLCQTIHFRFLNSIGIYKFSGLPNADMAITAIFIAIGTYFWNAAIFLLAKAKENAKVRQNVLA